MFFDFLPYMIVIVSIFMLLILSKRNELVVKAYSSCYRKIMCLNEEYEFKPIHAKKYNFTADCNNKKQFDKLDMDEYLMYIIERNERNIANIIKKVEGNRKLYHKYCSEYRSIQSTTTPKMSRKCHISYKGFLRIERRVCKEVKLRPNLKIGIVINAVYDSPKGQKHYSKSKEYEYSQIKQSYYKVKDMMKKKESYEYTKKMERLKMTDSLRYDILKRDNYRCRICGISAKDGAKLHVDHIIPIAKGGKTEIDNLQTLCDRCNMGKSDKY